MTTKKRVVRRGPKSDDRTVLNRKRLIRAWIVRNDRSLALAEARVEELKERRKKLLEEADELGVEVET